MSRRRLGCLTGTGLIAAATTLLLILAFVLLRGGRLFSPGPLNAQTGAEQLGNVSSHAEIGGDCGSCHTAPWDQTTLSQQCLECHTGVAAQLADPSTLHGALNKEQATLRCQDCHTEHRGADADLTFMDVATFPHEVVGFFLTGHAMHANGAPFNCADCHVETVARFDLATCQTCHSNLDPAYARQHLAEFGSDCLNCHDGVDHFSRAAFDHDLLVFSLSGGHAEIACGDCHLNARTVADLQDTPSDCVACHQQDDAHDGSLGTDCAACHVTDNWQEATFDHNLSNFPLTGLHVEVECAECHTDRVFQGTPSDCVACHQQDDAHDGQFGLDCAACHTTDDWQEATFDHNLSNFPLTGLHVEVECVECHTDRVFQDTPSDCVACHQDPVYHLGAFGVACADCHTSAGWQPARFDQPHTFPMDHGEAGVSSCQTCHVTQVQTYTCYTCHEHNEAEVREDHLDEGIQDFANCVECHATGQKEEGEED